MNKPPCWARQHFANLFGKDRGERGRLSTCGHLDAFDLDSCSAGKIVEVPPNCREAAIKIERAVFAHGKVACAIGTRFDLHIGHRVGFRKRSGRAAGKAEANAKTKCQNKHNVQKMVSLKV